MKIIEKINHLTEETESVIKMCPLKTPGPVF